MQETDSNLVETFRESVKALIVIEWKEKRIRIECASCESKLVVYDFVAHEVNEKIQMITFYFNSRTLKVALLDAPGNVLGVQQKDGRIENYALSKQLW